MLKYILLHTVLPKLNRWRSIEVVITASTRNRVCLTRAPWVRIPPSPPAGEARQPCRGSSLVIRDFLCPRAILIFGQQLPQVRSKSHLFNKKNRIVMRLLKAFYLLVLHYFHARANRAGLTFSLVQNCRKGQYKSKDGIVFMRSVIQRFLDLYSPA